MRSGLVDAQRNRTVVQLKDFHKYVDLVNLGVVGGSSHGDFYYMLQTIWALKIYSGADTVLWATVACFQVQLHDARAISTPDVPCRPGEDEEMHRGDVHRTSRNSLVYSVL
ncbi:hypothetical protein MRX96_011101 [Rhipicephalus microplus]